MGGFARFSAVVVISAGVAVAAAALLFWDSLVHSIVSSPQPGDALIARVCWVASLVAVVVTPLILSLRSSAGVAKPRWPVAEPLILAVAVVYLIGVFVWYWPRWPELLNSDLEVASLTFVIASAVFASGLVKAVAAIRARVTEKAVANLSVCAASWVVAFVVSWLMVYFE